MKKTTENEKEFSGILLVSAKTELHELNYKVINNIKEYEINCPCIVAKNLDPDYFLLFGMLRLIVTEHGGVLSHLAILAREYDIPVIRIEDITSKISEKGILSLNGSAVTVHA